MRILFICTGNTCRSPMAEALMKKLLLEENINDIDVFSRGISVFENSPASVNSMLSSLNALFIYLNWYDMKVKTLKIQRQIFADKEKELTKAEYKRLLMAAKNRKNERFY